MAFDEATWNNPFPPHSDAQFEFLQVILNTPTRLNELGCCHVNCINKLLNMCT